MRTRISWFSTALSGKNAWWRKLSVEPKIRSAAAPAAQTACQSLLSLCWQLGRRQSECGPLRH